MDEVSSQFIKKLKITDCLMSKINFSAAKRQDMVPIINMHTIVRMMMMDLIMLILLKLIMLILLKLIMLMLLKLMMLNAML